MFCVPKAYIPPLVQILDWCLNVYCEPSQTVDDASIQWSRLKDELAHAGQVNFVCKTKRRYLRWVKTAIEYAMDSQGGCGVDAETVSRLYDWVMPLCIDQTPSANQVASAKQLN